MPETLQSLFLERPFLNSDIDELTRIEEEAGNAQWSHQEIGLVASQLNCDTRVVTEAANRKRPIAFYVVEHDDATLYLCNLAVAAEWRRKGVALFALEEAAQLGRFLNYRELALDVQEENLAAQLLYRKAGFRVTEIRKGFYQSQDGYHMVRKLS